MGAKPEGSTGSVRLVNSSVLRYGNALQRPGPGSQLRRLVPSCQLHTWLCLAPRALCVPSSFRTLRPPVLGCAACFGSPGWSKLHIQEEASQVASAEEVAHLIRNLRGKARKKAISANLCSRKHGPGYRVDTGKSEGPPGLPTTRFSVHDVHRRAKKAVIDPGPGQPGPHRLGKVFQLGLMGHRLSLCLQLFLDDSKMKNFITCFKGTAAPSPPTSLLSSGKALEGSAPQPRPQQGSSAI